MVKDRHTHIAESPAHGFSSMSGCEFGAYNKLTEIPKIQGQIRTRDPQKVNKRR
jgi:hypothetical protein